MSGGEPEIRLRLIEPGDYAPIISVINDWWGGRAMADMLPKLFFVHFRATSFIAQPVDAEDYAGFLVGLQSQTFPAEAYIHFVGVNPQYRQRGIGRLMYRRFFTAAHERGCQRVRCVTSPVNRTSIAFHQRMGFQIEPGDASSSDGIAIHRNYDGHGEDRVLFVRALP